MSANNDKVRIDLIRAIIQNARQDKTQLGLNEEDTNKIYKLACRK